MRLVAMNTAIAVEHIPCFYVCNRQTLLRWRAFIRKRSNWIGNRSTPKKLKRFCYRLLNGLDHSPILDV